MGAAIAPAAAQVGGGALAGSAFGPIGMAIGAVGGAIGAFGTYEGMEAQSKNAAFQSQVVANNAAIAKKNFSLEIESGQQRVANEEMQLRSTLGTERVSQASSGVDVNSSSFAASRAGTAKVGTLNALTTESNSARQSYGYLVAATSDTAESELLESESSQASSMAPIAATGSLLSSASTVGANYAKYLPAPS
jgi:hypothetical protein